MNASIRRVRAVAAVAGIWAAAGRSALACPVCFGAADSPMVDGIKLGIFVLLAVTGVMLGSFAAFFVHLMRRAKITAGLQAGAPAAASGGNS